MLRDFLLRQLALSSSLRPLNMKISSHAVWMGSRSIFTVLFTVTRGFPTKI